MFGARSRTLSELAREDLRSWRLNIERLTLGIERSS